jgi:hypothetical protein
MGQTSSTIDEKTRQFIQAQKMFFVASAPLDPQGHVNLSPKGLDTFRVLSPTTVAYLDLTGSGVETIAHLRENGRIVVMFCAFEGPPNILRLYGRGRVVEIHEPEFESLKSHFGRSYDGERAIIVVELSRVSDSCGFAVPRLKYERDRGQLVAWAHKKGADGLKKYRQEKNRVSLDGLPGTSD